MKKHFQTTKEEREIINTLNINNIEEYMQRQEYWKVFRDVIKATKLYLKKKDKNYDSKM